MSEEERIAEVALPQIRVPVALKAVIEDLCSLELKGDKLKLFNISDIMREALLKGLRLMLLEREVFKQVYEKEAANGAMRIYASLKKPVVETPQATAGDVRDVPEIKGSKNLNEETEPEEGESESTEPEGED